MRFLFALVLFVTLCAAQNDGDGLPVIDLYPIIMGFDAAPPSAGDQGIWLNSRTILIDLEEVPLEENHLWEATAFAQRPTSGGHSCEYQIGYLDTKGNQWIVREGGFGGETIANDVGEDGFNSVFVTSSSVIFIRGDDLNVTATHVFIYIHSCSLGRYITRWEFEAWNGQAYLMDFSDDFWIADGWEEYTYRIGNFNHSTDGCYAINRDSTITEWGHGWWDGSFFFDYSDFMTLERPVLEMWFYIGPQSYGLVAFAFCNYTTLDACDTPFDFNKTNTAGVALSLYAPTSPFLRIFFDIKKSLYFGSTGLLGAGEDGFIDAQNEILRILLDETDGEDDGAPFSICTAGPSYAKMWDFKNDTIVSPFLFDGSAESAHFPSSTFCSWSLAGGGGLGGGLGGLGTADTVEVGYGQYSWLCVYDGATISWDLPPGIENMVNPWMQFFWYELAMQLQTGFRLTLDDELILDYMQPSSAIPLNPSNGEFQLRWGYETHQTGERFDMVQTGNSMSFLSVYPTFHGSFDYCVSDPCQNGGACHNWYFGYQCVCPIGWEGENCTINTDDCHMNSCLNGGVCVDEVVDYYCNCTENWEGHRCEVFVDNCPQDFCMNGGACVSGEDGKWSCDCSTTDGFSGYFCEHDDDNCDRDPFACQNGGVCVSGEGVSYTCECPDAWTGQWCEESVLCTPNPCQNDGVCILNDDGDVPECLCTGEHFGEWCEHDIEEYVGSCGGLVCKNGGVCLNFEDGTYGCNCRDVSWTGPFCDEPVVCTDDNNPCQNDAACVRGADGTAKCICVDGFTGPTCEEDWAAVVMQNFAEMAEDCRFGVGCLNDGVCTEETDGTYICVCGDDYFGDWCEDEVACAPNPCMNDGYCTKGADGHARCVCAAGFMGPSCEETFLDVLNDNFAVLTGDCRYGTDCENGGECVERVDGSFSCDCPDDYFGADCSLPTACSPNPCGDYGRCAYADGETVCFCSSNRFGPTCEYSLEDFFVPDCRFSGCENDGVCVHQTSTTVDEYVCVCTEEWAGESCEIHAECDPNPCGSGECVWQDGSATCVCSGDWFGPHCENKGLADRLDTFGIHLEEFLSEESG